MQFQFFKIFNPCIIYPQSSFHPSIHLSILPPTHPSIPLFTNSFMLATYINQSVISYCNFHVTLLCLFKTLNDICVKVIVCTFFMKTNLILYCVTLWKCDTVGHVHKEPFSATNCSFSCWFNTTKRWLRPRKRLFRLSLFIS